MKPSQPGTPSDKPPGFLTNPLGQPIGPSLPRYPARATPSAQSFPGQYCQLVPLSPEAHAAGLFAAFGEDLEGRDWTYLAQGPFASEQEFRRWLESVAGRADPLFFCVIEPTRGGALGLLSLMRVDASSGCIEIGNVHFAPSIQRTRLSTEAIALLARHVFEDLGYRRLEWKCDSLNAPSRHAALRLGFSFEGLFRQHVVYKNRSRDTAWYSMLDYEWPELGAALERWLHPSNFDEHGRQRQSLSACRESARK